MQNIKEEKEIEKLKLHTLREETKNGPQKGRILKDAEWEMQLNSNFYNPQDAGGEDCGEHGD